ncbi:sigma-70 family RNA polymerase sigma factor [Streptomyces sp. NPDC087440]|uniref:sigma-70 family RNA polymerase sigma factor n=1 Tax=Streptomyces sp. NPDC087440 TaxID=3365790 RepID=UPI00381433A4
MPGTSTQHIKNSARSFVRGSARSCVRRQPVEQEALRTLLAGDYHRYAQAFLLPAECRDAIEDTFAVLWLSFEDALASPDIRHYAWDILRSTVMAKTTYRDGRPALEAAVFDTVAAQDPHTSPGDQAAHVARNLELFTAISKLPDIQLDVMVLRHLCGFTPERTSELLGVPLAAALSTERHARRSLECALILPPETGGPTP